MTLIDTMKESFVLMDRVTTSDGLGGIITTWNDGAEFNGVLVKDTTMAARLAEKEGVTEVYTFTVEKNMPLRFHDVFKRLSDNATFRVTSNITDSKTPNVASFQFGQVTAERWDLP